MCELRMCAEFLFALRALAPPKRAVLQISAKRTVLVPLYLVLPTRQYTLYSDTQRISQIKKNKKNIKPYLFVSNVYTLN